MCFFTIVATFILAALAHAFVIPEGTTDGVYAVFTDNNGNEVHTKIAKHDPTGMTPVNAVHNLGRRQDDRIWCGCRFNMNSGNRDAALQALKDQLSEKSLPTNI